MSAKAVQRARKLEVKMTAALVGLCAASGALAWRSPLAGDLRTGTPFLATGPSYAVLYRPDARAAAVLVGGAPQAEGLPFAARAALDAPVGSAQAAHALLSAWPADARFWLAAVRWCWTRRGSLGLFDAALLAWEAARADPRRAQIAEFPPAALREPFLEALAGRAPAPAQDRAEVRNASGEPGLALSATRLLRMHGVDVVEFGNAPGPEAETMVVDRAWRPDEARQYATILGCPRAWVMTRFSGNDAPAQVHLGSDWRDCRRLAAVAAAP